MFAIHFFDGLPLLLCFKLSPLLKSIGAAGLIVNAVVAEAQREVFISRRTFSLDMSFPVRFLCPFAGKMIIKFFFLSKKGTFPWTLPYKRI